MNKIFAPRKLKNCFITNNSVILSQGRVVKESCVSEEFYKKYLTPRFTLKYFFPLFSLRKETHILFVDEWSKNYCHWLWEALSKLIVLQKEIPDAVVILPKSYRKIDFVMKSLEAFKIKEQDIKFIPKKSKLWVKNLAFIPCINSATPGYYDFLNLSAVRNLLITYHQENFKTNLGERIYISRSSPTKSSFRKIANEIEVTSTLKKYNFQTVYMEDLSFISQMSIMSSAKFVVAPHGAGITNFMFCANDSHLIEMVNDKWGSKTCFAEMCDNMKVFYHRIDCQQATGGTVELQDIVVDTAKLEQELIKILP